MSSPGVGGSDSADGSRLMDSSSAESVLGSRPEMAAPLRWLGGAVFPLEFPRGWISVLMEHPFRWVVASFPQWSMRADIEMSQRFPRSPSLTTTVMVRTQRNIPRWWEVAISASESVAVGLKDRVWCGIQRLHPRWWVAKVVRPKCPG